MAEDPEVRRKRLRYRSWHRGTRELDLLVGGFAEQHLAALDAAQLDRFEAILGMDEHLLYACLTGRVAVPAAFDNDVMTLLLAYRPAASRP